MTSASESLFVEIGENTIHARKTGSGSPVVFLHGFPDNGSVWEQVIAPLTDRFCCYAIDIPGFGKSTVSSRFSFSLEHQSAFFGETVAALGIDGPFHLVVHDLGAFPGLAFASDHPEALKSLTIFNADFHSDFEWYLWARVWRTPIIGEISMYCGNFPTFKSEMRKGSKKFTDAYLRKVYDELKFPNKRAALKYFRAWNAAELEVYEARYAARTSAVPKRVFWGELDPYSPIGYAARFGTDDIVYFEDSGHWLMIEEPEAVAPKLKEFLVSNDG